MLLKPPGDILRRTLTPLPPWRLVINFRVNPRQPRPGAVLSYGNAARAETVTCFVERVLLWSLRSYCQVFGCGDVQLNLCMGAICLLSASFDIGHGYKRLVELIKFKYVMYFHSVSGRFNQLVQ